MNRALLITLHMYLSAFFAPIVLLVATSGGNYLLGQKGSHDTQLVAESASTTFTSGLVRDEVALNDAVRAALQEAGVTGYTFEYVKVKGNSLITRPTSRPYYAIDYSPDGYEVKQVTPSLQAAMMELHMGHGPTSFKIFQKLFAAGLIFIILSGLLLGLTAKRLRVRTLATSGLGLVAFLVLAL